MAYQVLARKYRPQCFSDVAGQDHVTRTLMNALAQGRIAHGYIFSGHRGIGKTTIARILAMALNCRTAIGSARRATPEPCGVCESCTEIRAGNAVDVIEIDAATNRGIDEIRELRDAARYRPARDRYKIYILDEAHQITDAAFNALLKTLEEPPDHVVFMMATTQPEDIPQTIRSRCQHFSFHAVKFDDILTQLRAIAAEENVRAGDESLALLAEAGDGSMRDALSIMDQAIASAPVVGGHAQLEPSEIRQLMGSVPNAVFERLLEAIGENQSAPVLEEINRLLSAGNSASQLARQFVRYLRNVLMARIAGESSELLQLSPDERARAGRSALLFSEEDLTRFLQVMLRTFDELNYRQEPRFHLELGLLKLVHLQRLLPVEQLLSQLGGAAAAPKLGGGPLPGRAAGAARGGAGSGLTGSGGTVADGEAAAASHGESRASAPSTGRRPAEAPAPAASPQAPAFSPFEADMRRKGGEMASRPGTDGAAEQRAHTPVGILELDESSSGVAAGGQTTPANGASAAGVEQQAPPEPIDSPDREAASGAHRDAFSAAALQQAPEIIVAAAPDAAHVGGEDAGARLQATDAPTAPPAALAPGVGDLDAVRDHVCAALEAAGHNTAAALLGNGSWVTGDGDQAIRVEVAAKKTMLGLTINAEAEKICREAMRRFPGEAQGRVLSFAPGEASTRGAVAARSPAARPPSEGSVQAAALQNPLVKQAQELFRAEVRSVVDLRKQ